MGVRGDYRALTPHYIVISKQSYGETFLRFKLRLQHKNPSIYFIILPYSQLYELTKEVGKSPMLHPREELLGI